MSKLNSAEIKGGLNLEQPVISRVFDPADFETVDCCPWCQSPQKTVWGKDEGLFSTVQCAGCELIYVDRRLNPAGLEKYYRNYYSEEHQAVPESAVRNMMYDLEFAYIHQFIQKGKVLDVGCSGGELLEYFSKKGFECHGIEIGEEAYQLVRKKFGEKISQKPLLEFPETEKFDLIVFRGTIEHIPDPKETLRKAVRLLKKNQRSFIYITSTPNGGSVAADIFRTKWNQHNPGGHLYHFKVEHFDKFFAEQGMTRLGYHYFYEETPYANIEEDILKIARAIELKRQGKEIPFYSPPFYGNLMTVVYGTPAGG